MALDSSHRDLARSQRRQTNALIVLAVIAATAALYFARLVIIVLVLSAFLAFVLAPFVDLLCRLKLPRALGAAVATLLLFGGLYGVAHLSVSRASAFVEELPRHEQELRELLGGLRRTAEAVEEKTEEVLPGEAARGTTKVQTTRGFAAVIAEQLGTISEVVAVMAMIPFLLYFSC